MSTESPTKPIRRDIKEGNYAQAFSALCTLADPGHDFRMQSKLAKLYSKIPSGSLGLPRIKLALLATSTADHFAELLRYWVGVQGFELELFSSEFATMQQTVLDPQSELYSFAPDFVWLFTSGRDVALHSDFGDTAPGDAVAAAVKNTTSLWNAVQSRLDCQILQNTADLPSQRSLGNFEGSVPWSRLNLLRRYNLELAEATGPGVTLFDLEHLASFVGRQSWEDARWWYHSKHAFSVEASGLVAHAGAKLIAAMRGRAKKCLVLDLDNTCWGGVIGDDGVDGIRLGEGNAEGEAFLAFQRYALDLKARGIVLAVCSKNEEDAAKLPFEQHPEMPLKLDDIAVFKANWVDKATNIRDIAKTLNIGLDAIVFCDDNPVERALVREQLPMVGVPEMPADPSQYIRAVEAQHYFETTAFSADDRIRAATYRANAQRTEASSGFADLDGFLSSLEMNAQFGVLDEFHLPRFVQLLNKSNQFHLTTTRYNEGQVRGYMADDQRECLYFRLEDRFGDNGLISVLVVDLPDAEGDLNIDTWAMSCRVLSRGMEAFIAGRLVELGQAKVAKRLVGTYIPSKKNKLVRELYARLGFTQLSDEDGTTRWALELEGAKAPDTHIENRPNESWKRLLNHG